MLGNKKRIHGGCSNVTGCLDYLLRIESARVAASPGEGNTPVCLPVQTYIYYVPARFQVVTAVLLKIKFFWLWYTATDVSKVICTFIFKVNTSIQSLNMEKESVSETWELRIPEKLKLIVYINNEISYNS